MSLANTTFEKMDEYLTQCAVARERIGRILEESTALSLKIATTHARIDTTVGNIQSINKRNTSFIASNSAMSVDVGSYKNIWRSANLASV